MSRTDIQQVAGQEGLSSDVQEFLNGVLEDAMLRAVNVAPSSSTSKDTLRSASDRAPVVVISSGVNEAQQGYMLAAGFSDHQGSRYIAHASSDRTGPVSPRAP